MSFTIPMISFFNKKSKGFPYCLKQKLKASFLFKIKIYSGQTFPILAKLSTNFSPFWPNYPRFCPHFGQQSRIFIVNTRGDSGQTFPILAKIESFNSKFISKINNLANVFLLILARINFSGQMNIWICAFIWVDLTKIGFVFLLCESSVLPLYYRPVTMCYVIIIGYFF